MGSAVGQVPEYIEMVARWCKAHTRMPVIVKLTPNITDIRRPARAAKAGGADAVSLINTINSIMGVDLDAMTPMHAVDGKGTHGGMCGPAVKPIALSMVSEIARDPETRGLPISAIGGVTTWRDAAEFIALGAGNVQVCTAAMTYGFKIVQEMISGLHELHDGEGLSDASRISAAAPCPMSPTGNISTSITSPRPRSTRISASNAAAAISSARTPRIRRFSLIVDGQRKFVVNDDECVGCNLCVLVCPVESCITLVHRTQGVDPRTGLAYDDRPPIGQRIPIIRRRCRWRGEGWGRGAHGPRRTSELIEISLSV